MKTATLINVIVQGVGLFATVITMLVRYFDRAGGFEDYRLKEDFAIILGLSFLFICSYQLLHAFVTSILKLVRKEFNWLLGIYWILVVAYIIGIFVVLAISHVRSFDETIFYVGVGLAWIIVLYYFVINMIGLVKAFKK